MTIETEKALATDWGRNFAADGFRIAHNGGNLTCWIRATASRTMHVCITNEHGDSHYVENGESWLVAMHADSESSFDEYLAHSPNGTWQTFADWESAIECARRYMLAVEFAYRLRAAIGESKWREMRRLNADSHSGDGTCASHDFCDANMIMADAWHYVFRRTNEAGFRIGCGDMVASMADCQASIFHKQVKAGFEESRQ